MRLIDIEKCIKEWEHMLDPRFPYMPCQTLDQFIENAPTVDAVPVIRCKDCKYREEHHYEEDGEEPYIKYSCKFSKYSMSDNGFCSFGAKMDGGVNNG